MENANLTHESSHCCGDGHSFQYRRNGPRPYGLKAVQKVLMPLLPMKNLAHNNASHSRTEQSHRETLNVDRHHDGVRVRPRIEIVTPTWMTTTSARYERTHSIISRETRQRNRRTNRPPPRTSATKRRGCDRYT